jgi:hypothetical protein
MEGRQLNLAREHHRQQVQWARGARLDHNGGAHRTSTHSSYKLVYSEIIRPHKTPRLP